MASLYTMCYDIVMRLSVFTLTPSALLLGGCTLPWNTPAVVSVQLDPVEQFQQQVDSLGNTLQIESAVQKIISDQATVEHSYVYPIAHYTSARTKKVFGQYIPPDSGDRFSGYHTGDDIEVEDLQAEVPVYALTDATVVQKQTLSGYGGVVVLEFTEQDVTYHALYGHLDLASVTVEIGDTVVGGSQLGLLGDDQSDETDGERKHLHFGLYPYTGTELYAGYVQDDAALNNWLNPSDYLRSHQAADAVS